MFKRSVKALAIGATVPLAASSAIGAYKLNKAKTMYRDGSKASAELHSCQDSKYASSMKVTSGANQYIL